MSYNTSKYTNHSRKEIEEYLEIIKKSVRKGKYYISTGKNNNKNDDFIYTYNISSNRSKKMLLELEVTDFCYSVDNYNDPKERLYVFSRNYKMNSWGDTEKIDVYIKTTIKKDENVVIISFHKLEKNIKKLFEQEKGDMEK